MSYTPSEFTKGPPFRFTPMARSDRQNLVNIAGNQWPGSSFVTAKEFTLSALGASLDLHAEFLHRDKSNGVPANDLLSWRHVSTSGRDHHVKLVYGGYLFPLGHRATMTFIIDRVLAPDPSHPTEYAGAYLQIRTFIRVTEHLKTYPAPGQPYGRNAWPFSAVKVLTKTTPTLDPPSSNPGGTMPNLTTPTELNNYPQAFFPSVDNGNYVQFSLQFTDLTGRTFTTQMPVAFVFGEAAAWPLDPYSGADGDMGAIAAAYNALAQQADPSPLVCAPVPGTEIQFAPEVAPGGVIKPGATTHPTLRLVVGAATPTHVPSATASPNADQTIPPITTPVSRSTLSSNDQPAFYPAIASASIRLPAAESLSRSHLEDNSGPGGVSIFYFGKYVAEGFTTTKSPHARRPAAVSPHLIDPATSTNPGSIYAGLLNQPGLNFPADAVGGLATPNMAIQGLSAAAGAISGTLSQYANNAEALISEYFGSITSSKFLGGLSLSEILGAFNSDMGVPEITRHIAPDGTVTVSYTLSADLKSDSSGVFAPAAGGQFKLVATAVVTQKGQTTLTVDGSVDPFTISILGGADAIIEIPFGDAGSSQPGATFSAGTGKKTSVKPNVGQPSFEGALDFINTLEQFLSDIGGSGVSIDVTPTQVSASISLSLPSVGCGIFSLEDLALSASIVVPFLGDPTIATFGFCSADKPFSLTVMCFGGGGYVLVGVGLTSLESLTASLDFEGHLGLDLGVASGGVTAMAGITFSYTKGSGSTLTGFVRITGEVEVLGILSVTLELQLSLSYAFATNVTTGTATMTVSVSLCFFSVSVGITVQKTFNGPAPSSPHLRAHDGAPSQFSPNTQTNFGAQMDPSDWSDYCNAFAS